MITISYIKEYEVVAEWALTLALSNLSYPAMFFQELVLSIDLPCRSSVVRLQYFTKTANLKFSFPRVSPMPCMLSSINNTIYSRCVVG